jgi:hypothetical protein
VPLALSRSIITRITAVKASIKASNARFAPTQRHFIFINYQKAVLDTLSASG